MGGPYEKEDEELKGTKWWQTCCLRKFLRFLYLKFSAMVSSLREDKTMEAGEVEHFAGFWNMTTLGQAVADELFEQANPSEPVVFNTVVSNQLPISSRESQETAPKFGYLLLDRSLKNTSTADSQRASIGRGSTFLLSSEEIALVKRWVKHDPFYKFIMKNSSCLAGAQLLTSMFVHALIKYAETSPWTASTSGNRAIGKVVWEKVLLQKVLPDQNVSIGSFFWDKKQMDTTMTTATKKWDFDNFLCHNRDFITNPTKSKTSGGLYAQAFFCLYKPHSNRGCPRTRLSPNKLAQLRNWKNGNRVSITFSAFAIESDPIAIQINEACRKRNEKARGMPLFFSSKNSTARNKPVPQTVFIIQGDDDGDKVKIHDDEDEEEEEENRQTAETQNDRVVKDNTTKYDENTRPGFAEACQLVEAHNVLTATFVTTALFIRDQSLRLCLELAKKYENRHRSSSRSRAQDAQIASLERDFERFLKIHCIKSKSGENFDCSKVFNKSPNNE